MKPLTTQYMSLGDILASHSEWVLVMGKRIQTAALVTAPVDGMYFAVFEAHTIGDADRCIWICERLEQAWSDGTFESCLYRLVAPGQLETWSIGE